MSDIEMNDFERKRFCKTSIVNLSFNDKCELAKFISRSPYSSYLQEDNTGLKIDLDILSDEWMINIYNFINHKISKIE